MEGKDFRFADRRAAGQQLAEAVAELGIKDPVVLALPRGGVPVAYEVAKRLKSPLDILLVRKIGAPGHEEFGIGALVDGPAPQVVIDEATARAVGASSDYIEREIARQLIEIERRRRAYARECPVPVANKTVILVDDGIATGGTVTAALQALAKSSVDKVILAVPVAPSAALRNLSHLCDAVVCLWAPEPFYAVGAHYANFEQTSDGEVIDLLEKAQHWPEADHGAGERATGSSSVKPRGASST